MTFSRARVALTLSYEMPRDILPVELELCRVHVGHARTLLLGSLIAQERDCPFHVRMDGARRDVPDRGGPILDAIQCCAWLGIHPDWCYWLPEALPTREVIAQHMDPEAFDELVWTAGGNEGAVAAALDDAMVHHPSLIVRGSEFTFAGRNHGAGPAGQRALLGVERVVYAMLGRERQVATVPMVLLDGQKMSKSATQLVHWSVLQQVPPEVARRFLLATALAPGDPLAAMHSIFTSEQFSPEPYPWSWETWAEVVKQCP